MESLIPVGDQSNLQMIDVLLLGPFQLQAGICFLSSDQDPFEAQGWASNRPGMDVPWISFHFLEQRHPRDNFKKNSDPSDTSFPWKSFVILNVERKMFLGQSRVSHYSG